MRGRGWCRVPGVRTCRGIATIDGPVMTTRTLDAPRPVPLPGRADLWLLAAVVLLWGANWPVMKAGLGHAGPLWFAATRFITGAACLFAVVAAMGRLRLPPRGDWPIVASVGLLQMMLFCILVMIALQRVPPGRSAVLAYTTSLWVIPLATVLLGERVSRWKAVGTMLGLAGVAVLFNPAALDWSDSGLVWGHVLLLGAAVIWAVCIIHVRGHRWQSGPLELAPWQMLLAAVPLTVAALVLEGPVPGDFTAGFWLVTLYVGPVATGFCFWAVVALNRRLPATTLATAMLATPAVGILTSAVSFGETLGPAVLAGMALILAGMATVVLADRR